MDDAPAMQTAQAVEATPARELARQSSRATTAQAPVATKRVRQAAAHHWYCPQAMEWDAYLIQERYLNALGETGGFNWAWVLLASSCTARDHHPD